MVSHYDQLIQAGERKILVKQLRERFGHLDPETERRIETATIDQLETWATRVLSAATLAEALTD